MMKGVIVVGGNYIVSIQYSKDNEPIVLSRGMGYMDKKIREMERDMDMEQLKIRIIKNEELARKLFYGTEASKKLPLGLSRLLVELGDNSICRR